MQTWRMYRKKHESVSAIFCISLAWIYGKLPKIQKITKKCSDCKIHGLWLKDAFRNDQYTRICTSFLLCCRTNDIIFFVVLNPSFTSHTYLFSSLKQRSTKSNESQKDVQKFFCSCVSFFVGHGWEWQGY